MAKDCLQVIVSTTSVGPLACVVSIVASLQLAETEEECLYQVGGNNVQILDLYDKFEESSRVNFTKKQGEEGGPYNFGGPVEAYFGGLWPYLLCSVSLVIISYNVNSISDNVANDAFEVIPLKVNYYNYVADIQFKVDN